jgi:heme exporter protein D
LPEITQVILQWINMGGYAAFVWPAYAIAVVVLGGLAWHSWRAHRISETALDRLQFRASIGRSGRRADNANGLRR